MSKPSPSETNGSPPASGPEECSRLREQLAQLRAEHRALQEQARIWKQERDEYLRTVFSLLPPSDMTFTAEEIADLEKNGVGIEDILADLERPEVKPG
jgi:hypothetical protein